MENRLLLPKKKYISIVASDHDIIIKFKNIE